MKILSPQRLYLGELCLVWKGWQHQPEFLQREVEHVHAIALAVVGFGAALTAEAEDLRTGSFYNCENEYIS